MTARQLNWRFSPIRVALLLRNRMLEELPAFGIMAGLAAGINILSLVFFKRALFNTPDGSAWFFVFCLSGVFLAAGAFKAMHRGKSGCDWILLPATGCEQYTVAFVFCFILFPVAFMLVGWGLSFSFALAERVMGSEGTFVWIPFKIMKGIDLARLLAGMSLFFAGSARFRKLPLLKTAGFYTGFVTVFFIALTISLIMLGKNTTGGSLFVNLSSMAGENGVGKDLNILFGVFTLAVMPVSAFLYGYFRVSEKEARDEVQ